MSIENHELSNQASRFYSFQDGRFSFWEGRISDKIVVIRVREDVRPADRWIEKQLPPGIALYPAKEENIQNWLAGHQEYKISSN